MTVLRSISRRGFNAGAGAFFASAAIPRLASAASGRDPRLVVVVLRGALDGLSAVAPIGDPDYASLHQELALALGRRARGAEAQRLFRPQSRDDQFRQALRGETGAGRPRDGDQLSRAFAFRRAGRARKRPACARPHGERMAQPRRRGAAERRAFETERTGGRLYRAAHHARPGAGSRLGALRLRAAERRPRRSA